MTIGEMTDDQLRYIINFWWENDRIPKPEEMPDENGTTGGDGS